MTARYSANSRPFTRCPKSTGPPRQPEAKNDTLADCLAQPPPARVVNDYYCALHRRALAGGLLLISVWAVRKEQSHATFTGVNGGFDAVLKWRARLPNCNSCSIPFFTSKPRPAIWRGRITWDIKTNPFVSLAIPLAVGDNFKGYRLVGTLPELFEKVEYAPGKHYRTGRPATVSSIPPGARRWSEVSWRRSLDSNRATNSIPSTV